MGPLLTGRGLSTALGPGGAEKVEEASGRPGSDIRGLGFFFRMCGTLKEWIS